MDKKRRNWISVWATPDNSSYTVWAYVFSQMLGFALHFYRPARC